MKLGRIPLPAYLIPCLLMPCLLSSAQSHGQVTDTVFVHEGIVTGDYSGLPDQDHPEGPAFGARVAIDGEWLAVSAPRTLFHGGSYGLDFHGGVFLFRHTESGWEYMQRILHPAWNGGSVGCFSVALAVPHLVVGCPSADELNNPSQRSGIARWYRLDQDDIWQLDSGYHGIPGGRCGSAVAVSDVHQDGSVILAIGCPGEALVLGAVVIYAYDPILDEWSGPQFIQASDGESSDLFGQSLSLWRSNSGPISQKLAVGAPDKEHGGANRSGSVYLFEGENWDETATSTHPFPHLNEEAFYGSDVAINESQLLVGAPGGLLNACPDPPRCGLVRRYVFDGTQPLNLADQGQAVNSRGNPFGVQIGMQFGAQVALGPRNWIAAAAPRANGYDHNVQLAEDTGVVELRRSEDGSHGVSVDDYRAELRPDPLGPEELPQGEFGFGLDFSQSHLAIGSPFAGSLAGRSGEVWIYRVHVIDSIFSDRFKQ